MQHYAVFENIPLSNDLPTIPDTEIAFVSELPGSAYQIYGPPYFNFTTHRYSNQLLVVLFQDSSGNWMVGSNDSVLLDKIGTYETLNDFVDSNPANWHSYKCNAEYDSTGEYEVGILEIDDLNKGLLIALGVANPHAVGLYNVIGLKASIPSQIGASFKPSEIEANTVWYGYQPVESINDMEIINAKA